ncbi:hypothetical protein ACF0H5_006553 [Mactra antiquata]
MDFTRVIPFPGINISGLTNRISKNPDLLSSKFTILHVGTNNITKFSEAEILSTYNNLFTLIKRLSNTKLVISSIIPRPIDHDLNGDKVKSVIFMLKKLCNQRNLKFICPYRPFFKFGKPVREMFAILDGGLHLNYEGTRRLRLFFINTVAHLLKTK